MEENKKFRIVSSKKTRYLLPNILTLAGVCLGISSIKFSIDGNYSLAVTLILIAAILDALTIRNLKKSRKHPKSNKMKFSQKKLDQQ